MVTDHNPCADERPRKCPSHSHPDRTSSVYAHITTSVKRTQVCTQQRTGPLPPFMRLSPGEVPFSPELLLFSPCSWFSALMMLFMSSQLALTYSFVHTVLPRGSTLFVFSLPKPISNFAHQNCPERVVLSSVSKSGTLSWTSQNIAAFARSQL